MDKDKIRLANLRKQLWRMVREGATTVSLLVLIEELNNLTDKIMGERHE